MPGASPETMAATVATPLERQFGQIAGVSQMSSVSSLGSTVVTLQFDLNRNIDGAAQDVQAAITAAGAQLPKNLSDAADLSQGQSGRLADPDRRGNTRTRCRCPRSTISPRTSSRSRSRRFPASPRSPSAASRSPAIRVQVDPAKLQARALTLEDVRAALTNATTDVAKGTLLGKEQSFTIATNDQIDRSRRLQRCHHRLSQRRAGSGPRRRQSDRRTAGRHAGRVAPQPAQR